MNRKTDYEKAQTKWLKNTGIKVGSKVIMDFQVRRQYWDEIDHTHNDDSGEMHRCYKGKNTGYVIGIRARAAGTQLNAAIAVSRTPTSRYPDYGDNWHWFPFYALMPYE